MGKVETLYESDNFVIVNKPYDMYINSDDESEKNTVTYHIAAHDSHMSTSASPLHFVHRLDYATSGVLCIAKNKGAAARAGKLFEKRATKKYYLAIVRGHPDFELCDIEYQVGVDPSTMSSSHRMVAWRGTTGGATGGTGRSGHSRRDAHTRALLLETGHVAAAPLSVVLLKAVTGRRHQLRVHCSEIGHTILGDYTYSNAKDTTPHRMFLHAMRLVLPLPEQPIDIQTPEPFFSDSSFANSWRSEKLLYKYRGKEDFINACNNIDKPYIIGARHQLYKHF